MSIAVLHMLKTIKRPLFVLLIIIVSFCEHMFFAHSFQPQDSTADGNIPTLDVQMVAQKRWLVSKREFQNLQKELSYFIDKEIEKEKKRLIDKEDSKFHYMQNSFMKLVPSRLTHNLYYLAKSTHESFNSISDSRKKVTPSST